DYYCLIWHNNVWEF
nr:immunoglobulin light chain junction region [Macaca mulatta]MOX13419.1 immunoglobulin light chain junction region [Macaca mulatta]MOX13792.1 immunoglobulin light chain junction region [Macaca mulatta]MOX70392.1 immunoglobulin light chain junction region [Macaca mulatta]MOX71289.1 immunoglobulin light chain junction region [Macaca mulatta]